MPEDKKSSKSDEESSSIQTPAIDSEVSSEEASGIKGGVWIDIDRTPGVDSVKPRKVGL